MSKDRSEYSKEWYQKNKNRIKERNHIHYLKNKVEIKKRVKKYRNKNPHIVDKYNRKRDKIRSSYDKERYKNSYRNSIYKKKYNISLDDYNKLFINQYGQCLICKIHQSELSKALAVDHDHKTGEVRGLLCSKCNIMLGLVNDDTTILLNLIKYLSINNIKTK